MKNLMLTTAIVAVTSFGAYAQTTDTTTAPAGDQAAATQMEGQNVPAFLVSDFTGKDLYTLDVDEARNLRDQRDDMSGWERTSLRWESSETFTAHRDRWENVGSINDVVLTQDGQVRGVLIDVGGFLGIGARTVMVDIENLYFVADDTTPEDLDDFFVVAAMTESELESLAEWEEDQLGRFEARGYDGRSQEPGAGMGHDGDAAMTDDAATRDDATTGQAAMDTTGQTQDGAMAGRTEAPEGYTSMAPEERTVDNLMGADVYGAEGEQIGNVEDLVMGSDNQISHVVLDIGGFLGIGSHTVALSLDEVDVIWNDQDGDVRIQVPMTQEQLEQLPEHDA